MSDTLEPAAADPLAAFRAKDGSKDKPPSHFEESDPNLYHLVSGSRACYRLRIIREDGSYFSILYDDIHTLEGTEDGTKLTLCIKGGLLVTLVGKHLIQLADRLEECAVRKLYLYNPVIHKLKGGTSPIITHLMESSPKR